MPVQVRAVLNIIIVITTQYCDSGGQPKKGVETGPIHLIDAGLADQLRALDWTVTYDGPLEFTHAAAQEDPNIGKLKNPRLVSHATETVYKKVEEIAKKGWLPLTLGGDHSLAMGTISGTLRYAFIYYKLSKANS